MALKKANAGLNHNPVALETGARGELEQHGEQRRKRRWTIVEKRAAKAAKRESGGEMGEGGAVKVEMEAMKDEDDDVVFGKEIHVQRKSRKERKREWATNHQDMLPERRSGLNSKARRHVRRMLAAGDRDVESR